MKFHLHDLAMFAAMFLILFALFLGLSVALHVIWAAAKIALFALACSLVPFAVWKIRKVLR